MYCGSAVLQAVGVVIPANSPFTNTAYSTAVNHQQKGASADRKEYRGLPIQIRHLPAGKSNSAVAEGLENNLFHYS